MTGGSLMQALPALALSAILVGAVAVSDRTEAVPATRQRLQPAVNGPLLVLDARGGMGQVGPGDGQILVVQQDRVARVLARGLPFPFAGGIAPSPRGREVAYGEDSVLTTINPPRTQGLWLVPSGGGAARRLLLPPHSTEHNTLGIGPIAWSPDGAMLAYAVDVVAGVVVNPAQEHGLGLWLTRRYNPQPRLLATNAHLGAVDVPRQTGSAAAHATGSPFPIETLSWSPDGRTLAVSTFRVATETPAMRVARVILALTLKTGTVRMLVKGAYDGVYAPSSSMLAYVRDEAKGVCLFIADAQGQHERAILRRPFIRDIAWSPNGRSLAYIGAVGAAVSGRLPKAAVYTVNVATGQVRLLLRESQVGQPLLPSGGQFLRLAWLPAPA